MWYSIIDLRGFSCEIVRDKKSVADIIGISVPTLDKRLNGDSVMLHDHWIIGKSEPEKSNRGR